MDGNTGILRSQAQYFLQMKRSDYRKLLGKKNKVFVSAKSA
jgi:hypothetical protein